MISILLDEYMRYAQFISMWVMPSSGLILHYPIGYRPIIKSWNVFWSSLCLFIISSLSTTWTWTKDGDSWIGQNRGKDQHKISTRSSSTWEKQRKLCFFWRLYLSNATLWCISIVFYLLKNRNDTNKHFVSYLQYIL